MRRLMAPALFAVTLVVVGCKDKPAPSPAPAVAAPTPTPTVAAPTPAPTPAQAPTPTTPAAPAPDPAAIARSEQALAMRAAFLERAATAAKTAGGDCAQLGPQLATLTAEARALRPRRDLLPADLARDEAQVQATIRAITRMTSGCAGTTAVDDLVGAIAEPLP